VATLRELLAEQVPRRQKEIADLVKDHGDKIISEVSVAQAYGGMRGVKGLACDTSYVDPDKGLTIRGVPILELAGRLPEETFFLLLTGKLPDGDALADLQESLRLRREIPREIWSVLYSMPPDSHPMAMLSAALLLLEGTSIFRQKYNEGLVKAHYWEALLDDCLELLAKLPGIAAGIYRIRFRKGGPIRSDPDLDWGGDYAYMLGLPDPHGQFADLMRLYLVLHCDHEGGNVSAFSSQVVSSALSDPYYALSAGLNGLAGPLHGLANQECLKFVLSILDQYEDVPTEDQLRDFAWGTLRAGRVIPGYGHAVLRATDPRFTALMEFGKRVCPTDRVYQVVERLFRVVPDVLKEHGKAKNPWPNVDAGSGALLYHFGLTMFDYYTVPFAVSRSLGICAQMIWSRGLGLPIIRPKSVGTDWIRSFVKAAEKKAGASRQTEGVANAKKRTKK
jgi:citrate synthase